MVRPWIPTFLMCNFPFKDSFPNSCKTELCKDRWKSSIQNSFLQLFEKDILKGMWAEKSWNSQFYHPKLTIASVWIRKLWKEKKRRKVGIRNLPSKIYSCSCLKRTCCKECGLRKVEIHNFTSWFRASFENSVFSMVLKDIISIVLRSCRGTTLVKMNFGWSILDSYFSHPLFLS